MQRDDPVRPKPSGPVAPEAVGATTRFDPDTVVGKFSSQSESLPAFSVIAGTELGRTLPLDPLPLTVGRDAQCNIVLVGRGISRRHFRVEAAGDTLLLLDLDSTNGVYVNGVRVRRHVLAAGDRIHLGPQTVLRFAWEDIDEIAVRQCKYEEAIRDDLTGSYNRRHFDAGLEQEVGYSLRHGEALSVLLIDIDRFKEVNDEIGHPGGDEVLRLVARHFLDHVRREDLFARYGGEEFAVLLRGQDARGAWRSAERLRHTLAKRTFQVEERSLHITTSIGIATLDHEVPQSPSELMAEADRRLYSAKAGGRNRVVGADDPD